jgi:hypothetical protein
MAVLSAGVAVLASECFAPSMVMAGGFTKTEAQCVRAGGTPRYNKERKQYWCETPAADKQCERQADPDAIDVYWDVSKKRCEECFLTTACVHYIGLADDCFELSVLRAFRDNVLARMPGGGDDIESYYRHAPKIVERIGASADPSSELARLYARYILPSAVAARFGLNGLARGIYTQMMRDLGRRYPIASA